MVTATANVLGLLVFVHSPNHVFRCALVAPCATLANILIGYKLLLRRVRPAWPGFPAVRSAAVSSVPLGVTMALVVVLHYANNLIVRAYLGPAALGVFLAAFRVLEMASTLPGLVSSVFLPRLARLVVEEPAAAHRQARLFAQSLILAGAVVAAVLFAEAPGVVGLVYGKGYAQAVTLLRWMAVGVFFNFAVFGYTNALIMYGKDRVMIAVVALGTVVSVGGGLLLVPRLGPVGAAMVVAAIDLAGWLVSLPCYRRTIGTLDLRAWVWPLLGGVAVLLTSRILQECGLPLSARAPLEAASYAAVVAGPLRTILQSALKKL